MAPLVNSRIKEATNLSLHVSRLQPLPSMSQIIENDRVGGDDVTTMATSSKTMSIAIGDDVEMMTTMTAATVGASGTTTIAHGHAGVIIVEMKIAIARGLDDVVTLTRSIISQAAVTTEHGLSLFLPSVKLNAKMTEPRSWVPCS